MKNRKGALKIIEITNTKFDDDTGYPRMLLQQHKAKFSVIELPSGLTEVARISREDWSEADRIQIFGNIYYALKAIKKGELEI